MDIVINSIDYGGSIADGPGIRTVLYLQGCDRRCDGCHNPETWDLSMGKSVPIDRLTQEIRNRATNNKLTISGGEPLQQLPAVLELLKSLDDFNIALYTGSEIQDVPGELLERLDYIKVGRFVKESHCTGNDYIGSTNQRFIDLREGGM